MDFSQFNEVANTYTRKSGVATKEQSYEDLKYRRAEKKKKDQPEGSGILEGKIYVSDARWESLDLNNHGLKQFVSPVDGTVLLAVVKHEDATILKVKKGATEKVRNFKSVNLEAALEASKVIDSSKVGVNQFIKLTSVGKNITIKGVEVIEAFTLSVGEAKVKVEKEVTAVVEDASPLTPKAKIADPVAAAQNEW